MDQNPFYDLRLIRCHIQDQQHRGGLPDKGLHKNKTALYKGGLGVAPNFYLEGDLILGEARRFVWS